ncbi:MAG: translation initiation factor IF-2 associated domain-containing protein, partial [Phreatobacter sp.]|nr:translation initiation factor IF-2 associated domain-containing protein [Phreatobacter sp.]
MTDEKTSGDKTISLTGKTLSLKKPAGNEQSMVRQSFSHGRTKTVVVEKVSAKPRSFAPPRPPAQAPAPAAAPAAEKPR